MDYIDKEKLRRVIAHMLWEWDGGDISQTREYYLNNADRLIELCEDYIK